VATGKLSWLKVRNARKKMIGDGGGLWLRTDAAGNKNWIFRYTIAGRQREMGMGAVGDPARPTVGLDEARDRAHKARQQLAAGVDPLRAHDTNKAKQALAPQTLADFEKAWHALPAQFRLHWTQLLQSAWNGVYAAFETVR
jgi:hypothetical protein